MEITLYLGQICKTETEVMSNVTLLRIETHNYAAIRYEAGYNLERLKL